MGRRTPIRRWLGVGSLVWLGSGLAVLLTARPAPAPPLVYCATHEEARLASEAQASLLANQCTTDKEAVKICKRWLGHCKKQVATAHKCVLQDLKAYLAFEKAVCKTESGAAKKACLGFVKNDLKMGKADAVAAKKAHQALCPAYFETCRTTCD